jgi:hypothetical protein
MNRRTALVLAATYALALAWAVMGSRSDVPRPSSTPSVSAMATVAPPASAVPAHPTAAASPTPAAAPSHPAALEPAPAPGWLSEPLPEAAVPGPGLAALRSTGAIRGALHAADGRALAGVPVVALATDGADAAEDVTDAAGRYYLVALRPGRYAVFAGLGTPVAMRVGGRGATVMAGSVTPVALDERGAGATVHVRALDASGHALAAQALLVPAVAQAPSALDTLLASDTILLPGAARTVVEAVPPGRYDVVLLQGESGVGSPAQVDVTGSGDLVVEIQLPAPVAVTAL